MMWRLGVAGSPIEHSVSPQLHDEGLRLAGLDGSSERVEIRREDAARLGELLGTRFDALSITMPLKDVAGDYCDSLDAVAERTGSVNSLLVRDGRVLGTSTDGQGFLDALSGQMGLLVEDRHAVVLGAGGAARAIVDALVGANVASVAVHGRTQANVEALTSRYENVYDFSLTFRPIDLIVNTVPASGRVTEAAVLHGVGPGTVAVDITYEPRVSAWRALYEQAGCRTQNGLAMLAYQAALQMQWWWDVAIDGAALLEVVS
jgi:shikimate dehydrogenase